MALRVWMGRLGTSVEVEPEVNVDDDTEDFPIDEFEQLSLF